MASGKFVSYLRVSTQRQGKSGLGLDAQREAVSRFLNGGDWELVQEFVEAESGKRNDRTQFRAALALCKRAGATLIVAKLDRLSRNVRFFLEVLDESGVEIRFADLPELDARTDEGRMMLTNLASFAEFEGRRISSRTKAAIEAKRARVAAGADPRHPGVTEWSKVWGVAGPANLKRNIEERQQAADEFAARLRREIDGMKREGLSQRAMVAELNRLGRCTPKGGAWTLVQLQRLLKRQAELAGTADMVLS